MGSVKVDIHSGELFYKDLTFSDVEVVKLLLRYRDKYDEYFRYEQENHFDVAGDVKRLNAEAINTFTYLDELVAKCNFKEDQLVILHMVQEGYSYQEIADELGKTNVDSIRNRFDKISRSVVDMNDWLWRKYVYMDKLGLKTKTCSKCKEDLPATDEFFSPDDSINDGFKYICRLCRK